MSKREIAESMHLGSPIKDGTSSPFSVKSPKFSANCDEGFFNQRKRRDRLNKSVLIDEKRGIRKFIYPLVKNHAGSQMREFIR